VDWYPTLLKLAGATLDQALPLDGRDAWPTIARGERSPHEEIPPKVGSKGARVSVSTHLGRARLNSGARWIFMDAKGRTALSGGRIKAILLER